MDAKALHADVKKALQFIANKHGITADTQLIGTTDTALRFTVTMGEQLTQDMREYLAIVTPEMKRGHDSFKRGHPGLSDDMLGKRFRVRGEWYVYLGCITKRPAYPVSVLRIKGSSYRQLKCTGDYLTQMIEAHQRATGKDREQEVQQQLRQVNPELAAEANFS